MYDSRCINLANSRSFMLATDQTNGANMKTVGVLFKLSGLDYIFFKCERIVQIRSEKCMPQS